MVEELKPCPFCGGKPLYQAHQIAEDAMVAFVNCQKCGVQTEHFEDAYAPAPKQSPPGTPAPMTGSAIMSGEFRGTVGPILNQAWEDVADDVTGAIEKAVQPLLKKAVDDIYGGLLDATQDYLKENVAFNIASRISTAEREAAYQRERAEKLASMNVDLALALRFYADEARWTMNSAGVTPAMDDRGHKARAALSRALESE